MTRIVQHGASRYQITDLGQGAVRIEHLPTLDRVTRLHRCWCCAALYARVRLGVCDGCWASAVVVAVTVALAAWAVVRCF